ncbi:uncharacterized protein STEHIDRAFT_52285, partial [Stereum hirsutum FP-91666 SS1]|uniref:uncharacterized protein n=1 Tax=Stereum hirsutum (strain FP-91666) TaxID=721885 RepID=UPI000440B74E
DGRFHTACGHFVSMSTRLQDCLRPNCLFSRRHPVGCKSPACCRMMSVPVRNPIRRVFASPRPRPRFSFLKALY